MSQEGYYPLHYRNGVNLPYEWQDELTLYPREKPQDLQIWAHQVGAKIPLHLADPTSKQWSANWEAELIPGYPVTLGFSSDTYSSSIAKREVRVTTNGNISFRYRGPDLNLFYGIKAVADSGYTNDFILKKGIYSFKTDDGASVWMILFTMLTQT